MLRPGHEKVAVDLLVWWMRVSPGPDGAIQPHHSLQRQQEHQAASGSP
jgi:hypothetical protein